MSVNKSMIPVIDFYEIHRIENEEDVPDHVWDKLAGEVVTALTTIGFFHLRNHGVSDELLTKCFDRSKTFFALPVETKVKCQRTNVDHNHGYIGIGTEVLDPNVHHIEIKESFNFMATCPEWPYPEEEMPDLKKVFLDFHKSCGRTASRIMKAIAIGLNFEDKDFFRKSHRGTLGEQIPSPAAIRMLHYLPVQCEKEPGMVRCGTHSDYGTITLLFQDAVGGLQVKTREKGFVDVSYQPDCVLVNLGELMQRWTADKLIAAKHRVLYPEREHQREARYSLVFFVSPDDHTIIESIDGSNKYPPIRSDQHSSERYAYTNPDIESNEV